MGLLKRLLGKDLLSPGLGLKAFFRYFGPGLLVTVGFIDPGNWATNISAGADFGYELLWVLTLSTLILIFLQHNVAHLGIVTGKCLSEAATLYLPKRLSHFLLGTAILASIATSLAEVLGGALALQMLFHIPLKLGSLMVVGLIVALLLTNSYRRLEKVVIGFVSIIGFAFLYELFLADVEWGPIFSSSVQPTFPEGSALIIMGVLGAVVMPHNLFLHSEFIQTRQWNLEDEKVMKRQLDYEFFDTLFAMLVGLAINSAMMILAAGTFYKTRTPVTELSQAQSLLTPLLGGGAGTIFALALLCSGLASTLTSALAGGSIWAGIFAEPFNIEDKHSRQGVFLSLFGALILIFFIENPFKGLIYSQVFLSMQLPLTLFLQVYLTSSPKVMGRYANSFPMKILLFSLGLLVTYFNIRLLLTFLTH